MTTATAVLDTVRYYLDLPTVEDPAHSNQTIIGVKFGWSGVPWCAETVTVCQHEAGNTSFNGSASCSQLVGWYQDGTNGAWLGNPGTAGLQPGDEFFMGSRGQDHTGLVESLDGDAVITVEGNWGDKVARVSRPVTAFFGFGRPNYTTGGLHMDADVQARFDAMQAEIAELRNHLVGTADNNPVGVEPTVAHLERMLGSAIDVIDAIKAKLGA